MKNNFNTFSNVANIFNGAKTILLLLVMVLIQNFGFSQEKPISEVQSKTDTVKSTGNNKDGVNSVDTSANYVFASYPGGTKAFTQYLIRNIRMPAQYINQKLNVKITVTFTIEESGKLKNFRASEGPSDLKQEAIRVVKGGGKWIPAIKDGKPITSEREQNISFITE